MQSLKAKKSIGGVTRGFVLASVFVAGLGAVFNVAATVLQHSNATTRADASEQSGEFERLAQSLNLDLSDEQRTQIREIETEAVKRQITLTEQLQTLEQMINNQSASSDNPLSSTGLSRARAALEFDLQSIPTRTRQEIRRILTVEQKAKLDAE